jgi:hypothetical protein
VRIAGLSVGLRRFMLTPFCNYPEVKRGKGKPRRSWLIALNGCLYGWIGVIGFLLPQ